METKLQVTEIKEDFWEQIPLNIKTKMKVCEKDVFKLISNDYCGTVFEYLNDTDYTLEYNKALNNLVEKVIKTFHDIKDKILVLNPKMFDLLKKDEFNRVMIVFYFQVLSVNI